MKAFFASGKKIRCIAIAVLLALAACSDAAQPSVAQQPADDATCSLDGMTLKDFPGPKAQIQYTEGQADYFCDLIELFSVVLAPEQRRHVAGIFVQDMGKAEWDHPVGQWIDAKRAIYVTGSKKRGSMGPAFAAFSRAQDAASFIAREGGVSRSFTQITPALLGMRTTAKQTQSLPP